MNDKPVTHAPVDPERTTPHNPFDHDEGLFGQSYSREREEALRAADPSGAVGTLSGDGQGTGKAASVDPHTGEVHGSGADAGEDPVRKPGGWRPGAGKNAVDD